MAMSAFLLRASSQSGTLGFESCKMARARSFVWATRSTTWKLQRYLSEASARGLGLQATRFFGAKSQLHSSGMIA